VSKIVVTFICLILLGHFHGDFSYFQISFSASNVVFIMSKPNAKPTKKNQPTTTATKQKQTKKAAAIKKNLPASAPPKTKQKTNSAANKQKAVIFMQVRYLRKLCNKHLNPDLKVDEQPIEYGELAKEYSKSTYVFCFCL
jgi:hypothetical protein